MRIRKQPRGDARGANVTGEASASKPGLGSGENAVDSSSRGVKEKQDDGEGTDSGAIKERGDEGSGGQVGSGLERGGSGSRSSFTWLDKLRHAKGFTAAEPHVNLDDFVSSLVRKDSCSVDGETPFEPVAGESTLSRSVVNVDLNAGTLARDNSVESKLSSKPAGIPVLERTTSLALVSCVDSSMSAPNIGDKERADARLRSDASLPKPGTKWSVAERGKNIVEDVGEEPPDTFGVTTLQACEDDDPENSALGYYVREQEGPRLRQKSSGSSEQATSNSWLQDSSDRVDSYSEAPEHEKKCPKSTSPISKRDSAVTSSVKQKHEDTTAARMKGKSSHIPLSPGTVTAIMEQERAGPATRKPPDAEPTNIKLKVPEPDNIESSASQSLQRRSSRNRRVSSSTGGEVGAQPAAMAGPPAALAPDHPTNQPKESLFFSMYTVFFQAGKAGLTTREAVSTILQQCLAGLEEGGADSHRRVGKILRSSPYYMELEDGKFALCTAVIDAEQTVEPDERAKAKKNQEIEPTLGDRSRQSAESEDSEWKHRLRGGIKRKRAAPREASDRDTDEQHRAAQSGRPKRLKYMKQENVEELGNKCNRTDGKGWTCPLLAKPGYQLCDHHLDKLRCKPGSRSKKKASAAMADEPLVLDQPLAYAEGPHMVRRKTRTSRSALPTDETEILRITDTAGHESTNPQDTSTSLQVPVEEHSS